MCPEHMMQENTEEQGTAANEILMELEIAHQARLSRQMLEHLQKGEVDFQQIAPDLLQQILPVEGREAEAALSEVESQESNAYVNLLEQMRHIYSGSSGCSSWSSSDSCYPQKPDCGFDYSCTTWNDCDCCHGSYPMGIQEQLNRIERMVREICTINQQLYSYLLDYYQKFVHCNTGC